jgi:tRNA (adenine22-N1)-methyltransferase
MDSPWRTEYLTLLLNRTSRALEGLRRSTKPGDAGRLEELTERYADLARMKEEWDKWQR